MENCHYKHRSDNEFGRQWGAEKIWRAALARAPGQQGGRDRSRSRVKLGSLRGPQRFQRSCIRYQS
jgi:hypothetical protein